MTIIAEPTTIPLSLSSTKIGGYMDEQEQQPEWITVKEAAVIMRVSGSMVRRLCRDGHAYGGRIRSDKWGNSWRVNREDAINYKRSKRDPKWLYEKL